MNYIFSIILLLSLTYINIFTTDISVMNLTSGQITLTIQTTTNNYSQSILPLENPNWNDLANPTVPPTKFSYNSDPITKIIITRSASSLPTQIIYYDNQNNVDNSGILGGIGSINRTMQATMYIQSDFVTINNINYNVYDLNSFLIRCQTIENNLSTTNLDISKQKIDDVNNSVQKIKNEDKSGQTTTQIIMIQGQIDRISTNINILKELEKNLQTINDLSKNLSLLTLSSTENSIQNLQYNLQLLQQTNINLDVIKNKLNANENALQKLQMQLTQFKQSQHNFGTAGSVVMQ
ncbi:MAG: hypothetical protein ACXWL2_02170 [Candidatus Chromulinivorax sp.]